MELKKCTKCKHYIIHENDSVMCYYYDDMPMARTLLRAKKRIEDFVLDCPIEPKTVLH
jgi:hypothetical protein